MRCAKALTSCTKNGPERPECQRKGREGEGMKGGGMEQLSAGEEIRSCGSEVVVLVVVVVEGGVLLGLVGGCRLLQRV